MKYEEIVLDGKELKIITNIPSELKDDTIIKNLDDTLELVNIINKDKIEVKNYEEN